MMTYLSRGVALVMHTHLLSPVKFANDISKNSRDGKLAGSIDFPLLQLLARIEKNNPDDVLNERLWRRKFSFPYNLLWNESGSDRTFPPILTLALSYGSSRFTFPNSNPFGLDLVQAVKRQIDFADGYVFV
jgi:hypothetical protein